MHPVVYYIAIFIVAGGIGMAAGSRHVSPEVRRQRWIKFSTYILITGAVIVSMFTGWFLWLAAAIVVLSLGELVKVSIRGRPGGRAVFISFLLFAAVGTAFLQFARSFEYGFQLFIYFQVLVFDGFCQVAGQLLGKHPLAPAISPAKTWEGWIGGWLMGIIAAVLAAGWLKTENRLLLGLISGLITGPVGAAGDLLASYCKRKVHVKDYSNWLPGQGGFLDRFDSFLAVGAVCYLLTFTIFDVVLRRFYIDI